MHHIGSRIKLPVIFGSLAIALILWDYHNQHVIEGMGMAWDMGAPIWPYQTSWILLFAINAPAYFLSAPLFYLLNLQTAYGRYPLQFLSTLFLWWWVGSRIDWGLLGRRDYRHPRIVGVLLSTTAIVLLFFFADTAVHQTRLWLQFHRDRPFLDSISLLTAFGPLLWSIAIGFGATQATVRLVQGHYEKNRSTPGQLSFRKAFFVLGAVVFAILIGIIIEHKALQP